MRWPKPISRSPRARAARSQAWALSGVPMASSISITGPGAPPCSGPFRAEIPASTAEVRPARVDATTRAAKVEAFRPWSQTVTR
jgi:hypothetical protein